MSLYKGHYQKTYMVHYAMIVYSEGHMYLYYM